MCTASAALAVQGNPAKRYRWYASTRMAQFLRDIERLIKREIPKEVIPGFGTRSLMRSRSRSSCARKGIGRVADAVALEAVVAKLHRKVAAPKPSTPAMCGGLGNPLGRGTISLVHANQPGAGDKVQHWRGVWGIYPAKGARTLHFAIPELHFEPLRRPKSLPQSSDAPTSICCACSRRLALCSITRRC